MPILAALGLAFPLRDSQPKTANYVTLGTAAVVSLCWLAMGLGEGADPEMVIEWLPGTGPMGLSVGASGLYTALVTSVALLATALLAAPHAEGFRPASGAVSLLALAAASTALLTDHFLSRYVALEIVALCVALTPLIEMSRKSGGGRVARGVYLMLRVGDAGLLAAILILDTASGTLKIDQALAHALSSLQMPGAGLGPARLDWIVAGLLLAAWVKLGGWPFHVWSLAGRRLSVSSHTWLYGVVVPNLGAYLLYRVTPLIPLSHPISATALWVGAGGAALSALMAISAKDKRVALIYIGATQAGLAVLVAATGVKQAAWLWILAITPLRLLLFQAYAAHQRTTSSTQRTTLALHFTVGGMALVAFSALMTWWARSAGAPLYALVVAELSVALVMVWVIGSVWELFHATAEAIPTARLRLAQWVAISSLATAIVAGGLAFKPLVYHLAAAAGWAPPTMPSLVGLLQYLVTTPALIGVCAVSLAAWRLRDRARQGSFVERVTIPDIGDLEEALSRGAEALHSLVEVGISERFVNMVVRIVMAASRAAWTLEHKGLDGLTSGGARAIMNGAQAVWTLEHKWLDGLTSGGAQAVLNGAKATHRSLEEDGFETLLQRSVRGVVRLSRVMQRWHSGRLRRNLLWLPIVLTLAVVLVVAFGW